MLRMGFDHKWVRLIMMCVTIANYEVLVNGNTTGKIFPTHGLRQGDPISPYIFLICAKALSSLLIKADIGGSLQGVPTSRRGSRINHLFFVNDSLIFYKVNLLHWRRLIALLKTYEAMSG